MSSHRTRPVLLLLPGTGAVALWWAWGAPAATVVVPVLVWVVIAAAAAGVVLRYRVRRRAHLARVGARAAENERARLAAEMHDVLGHELALLATQAARLEMTPDTDPAGQAARIRRRSDEAVARLHDVLRLLGATDRTTGPDRSPRTVLDEAAAAGLDLRVQIDDGIDDPREIDPVVAAAVTGLVREAVTNAVRHAPGRTVDVAVRRVDAQLKVCVENATDASRASGRRSGLATWDRRLHVIGGELHVATETGRHRLTASVPVRAELRTHLDDVPLERPPWVAHLAAPLLALALVVVGGWSMAAHDRTLGAEDFGRLRPGQPAAEVQAFLPPREALVVLAATTPDPSCRHYSDGSLPLAQASFEVCVRDGRVTGLRDLR